jgi:hypothetical protein
MSWNTGPVFTFSDLAYLATSPSNITPKSKTTDHSADSGDLASQSKTYLSAFSMPPYKNKAHSSTGLV